MVNKGTAKTTDKEETVSLNKISLISVISRLPFASISALSQARFPRGNSKPKEDNNAKVVFVKLYPAYSSNSCIFSGVYLVINLPNPAKKPPLLIPCPLKEGFELSSFFCIAAFILALGATSLRAYNFGNTDRPAKVTTILVILVNRRFVAKLFFIFSTALTSIDE